MDLRKLRHMVVLSEELNFARTAQKVHLTQSALSRSIQSLEEELGGKLFDRDLQGVALTAIGRQVVIRAREMLAHAGNLKHEVTQMQNRELGDVKLGAGPFPGATFLPPVLAELARNYPRLRVEVEINNSEYLMQHLQDEHIEFFIAEVRSIDPNRGIAVKPIARQLGGFFCRPDHPLASVHIRHQREILAYPLAAVRMPVGVRAMLLDYLGLPESAGLPLNLICDNPEVLSFVTLHSDSILLSGHTTLHKELADGSLINLNLPNPPSVYAEMGVVTLAGRSLSPTAAWLVERMQDYSEKMAERRSPLSSLRAARKTATRK